MVQNAGTRDDGGDAAQAVRTTATAVRGPVRRLCMRAGGGGGVEGGMCMCLCVCLRRVCSRMIRVQLAHTCTITVYKL